MTLEHILKKFITLILFDCIGAIFTWGFVDFRSVLGEETQKKNERTFPRLDRIDLWRWLERLKKLD